jgi:hypothetical protein
MYGMLRLNQRFATWHDKQGKAYKTWKRTEANAADDLLTTIEDYGKVWGRCAERCRIISGIIQQNDKSTSGGK